jgi:hypothetical protein
MTERESEGQENTIRTSRSLASKKTTSSLLVSSVQPLSVRLSLVLVSSVQPLP